MNHDDLIIVGGGVIGLSIAYVLAREGMKATVLDRRELGREASWAGAGLIPPYTRRVTGHPAAELRSWSAALYPELSAALHEETGIDNGFRRTGGVDVAWTAEDENALRRAAGRWRSDGIVFERMLPADFSRVEPALNPALRVGYYLPDRSQIRNPWHLQALVRAATLRGVTLQPHQAVVGFEVEVEGTGAPRRIRAVRTVQGRLPCGCVVVAAGPWSAALLEGVGVQAPTPPIKGQIVLLRSDRKLLSRIVEHGNNYLVPRDDGRVLVGATEENAGFDYRTTPTGLRDLLGEALQLCPVLAEAEVERSWAGLRPGSIDSRPYLGRAPGFENLIVATGHHRAGLQLAPATAEVIADLVLGRSARIDLDAFRVDRPPGEPGDPAYRS
jgi:glycine oxidase